MASRLANYFPVLKWGANYSRAVFAQDAMAALIVTVLVIPQSLAYALLAGLPPEAGLYASILPALGYAVFGSGKTLAVGPVAVIALMSAAAVGEVAQAGTADYLTASILLALLSGLMLLAMGLLRLGFLSNFISHPVVSGFITASGLLIAASQFKHLLGVAAPGDNLLSLATTLFSELGQTNLPTLIIGSTALIFLYAVRLFLRTGLDRLGLTPKVADILVRTGPLLAVITATIAVSTLDLHQAGVAIVGEVPPGLPALQWPDSPIDLVRQLWMPALLISVVTFVESVSIAHKLAVRRKERIDPDQELRGLGAANIAAALSGGFAVAGGFSRSVVNFDAGARTPAAGAMTAIGIGLATLFLTPLLFYLPKAVLAATIIVAVMSLVDVAAIRQNWRYSSHDGAALTTTLAITLLIGVTPGILTGIALSLLLYLYRTSRPHSAIVGRLPGSEHFRNIARHEVETDPQLLILRVDESLYFANARYLEDCINDALLTHPDLTDFVLMCPAVNHIDASALESLEAINHRLRDAGITLHLSEVKGPVMDRLSHSHFLAELSGQVYLSTYQAWCELHRENAASRPDPDTP